MTQLVTTLASGALGGGGQAAFQTHYQTHHRPRQVRNTPQVRASDPLRGGGGGDPLTRPTTRPAAHSS
eukprot:1192125-Prorocentrum_minimum.AAC.2